MHGSEKRKSPLQRSVEQLEKYIDLLEGYNRKLEVCGELNSYSKTDTDATFMRLKEDAMLNGQLKPAYNLQHAVDSEYIVWADISAHPADTKCAKKAGWQRPLASRPLKSIIIGAVAWLNFSANTTTSFSALIIITFLPT